VLGRDGERDSALISAVLLEATVIGLFATTMVDGVGVIL
jgi:hypothetical protein